MAEDQDSKWEEHVKSRQTWMRLLFMILFAAITSLVGFVLGAVVLIQFLVTLFSGQPNPNLKALGQGLATYCYEIIQFLCYNTERQPFPFTEWPEGPPEVEDAKSKATRAPATKKAPGTKKAPATKKKPGSSGTTKSGDEGT